MKRSFLGSACSLLILLLSVVRPAYSFSLKAIPAKACIIMNADDDVLYAKNPSAKLPPASTVKLVTSMVALDRLDPSTMVTVSRHAAATRSIRPRLIAGDQLTVADLLHLALMNSINSAAVALAEAAAGSEDAFVPLMNRKAQEIGASDTHFENASGLPTRHRQYTTVRDLTIILKNALTYPLIKEIVGKKESIVVTAAGRELFVENTDSLLWSKSNMIGGKTGFTCSARHCFVGAMDTDNGPIFTAVLGAPSRSRLWSSTLMLVDLGTNPELISSLTSTLVITPLKKHRYRHRVRRRVRVRKRPKVEALAGRNS